MYCTQCGAPSENPTATVCSTCGAKLMSAMLAGESIGDLDVGGAEASRIHIPNYLVQSVLVTFFCCLPFGIPAIVYAAQVDDKLKRGDIAGAQRASSSAKTWCWVSFAIGVVSTIFFVLLGIVGALAERN